MKPTVKIMLGDNRERLRELATGSVQMCVTSPPYWGQRDYQEDDQIGREATPEEYVDELVGVFREVKRVLRDDGTCWLNLGDKYGTGGSGQNFSSEHGSTANSTKPAGGYGHIKSPPVKGMSKQLLGIPWRVAFALQADGWILRSDVIWCLGANTRIYAKTQKGEMPMTVKDVTRLDPKTVQLWNGNKWTQVLGWSKSRCKTPLELVLRSGERISCTPNHVWPTQRGGIAAVDLRIGDVIPTCRLPEPDAVRKPEALDDEFVGWFVGVYLAEGSRSGNAIQISSHIKEEDRFRKLRKIADAFDGYLAIHQTSPNGCTANLHSKILHGIVDTYIGGKTAKTKHLKVACWKRSNVFLRAVLDGYLHGDGGYDAKNKRHRLGFCRNYLLESDLRVLSARLGFVLRLRPTFATAGGEKFPSFHGEIKFEKSGHGNECEVGAIIQISPSNGRAFWDIGVADDPHLFALASGVLTHNSKPNAMPGSQRDRLSTNHEYLFLFAKQQKYFYDDVAIRERASEAMGGWQTRAAKGLLKPHGNSETSQIDAKGTGGMCVPNGMRTKRTVWSIPVASSKEAHFAVFPPALIEPCILAGTSAKGCCGKCGAPLQRITESERIPTRPGHDSKVNRASSNADSPYHGEHGSIVGNRDPHRHVTAIETVGWEPTCDCYTKEDAKPCTILDPFGGSGTTGAVALKKGRSAILIELNAEYVEIMKRKLQKAQSTAGFML